MSVNILKDGNLVKVAGSSPVEWTGTRETWNSLTSEQKSVYNGKIVNITNDYEEDGLSGWSKLTGKPFNSIDDTLTVTGENNVLGLNRIEMSKDDFDALTEDELTNLAGKDILVKGGYYTPEGIISELDDIKSAYSSGTLSDSNVAGAKSVGELASDVSALNSNKLNLASAFFGDISKFAKTSFTDIDAYFNGLDTSESLRTFKNNGVIYIDSKHMGSTQFGIGWITSDKQYAWCMLMSINGFLYGKKSAGNNFVWTKIVN